MATTKTELLNNGVVVATKTAAPFYSWDWIPATSGASSLTVKVWEDSIFIGESGATTGTVDAAAGDTTAPTILSATVEDANKDKLVVVFSEVVNITDLTGLTITGDVTPTLSAPTGTGTNTITFTLSAALTTGQSVTLNVDGTNTIEDTANNALAIITQAVTNNVGVVASYDVDYQAVLDYATAQSIALPTTTQQDLDNQFIIDYKASGGWALDDTIFRFKSTASTAFKLICWKRRIQAIAYGGLTWSDSGVKGNGTNGYIDPLFNPTVNGVNYTLNNASIGFSLFDIGSSGLRAIAGVYTGAFVSYVLISPNNSNQSYLGVNGSLYTNSLVWAKLGYTSANRISAATLSIDTTDIANSSGGLVNEKIMILARNQSASGTQDAFSDAGLGFISFGANKKSVHNAIALLF